MTFHIRRRLVPKGGNNFYRDKNERRVMGGGAWTYCGADPTSYDQTWRDLAEPWKHPTHGEMVPCARCLAARAVKVQ